jgi:hypothetical protein
VAGSFDYGNEPSNFIKGWKYIDYWLVKDSSSIEETENTGNGNKQRVSVFSY